MNGWTEERVEELKSLWGEGLSASQIARVLGGLTRNAVVGKVHRLGLAGRDPHGKKSAAGRGVSGFRAPRVYTPKAVAPPPPPPVEIPALVLEDGSHVGTMQLTSRACRWPIGDPQEPDFHYCGHPAIFGQPYCAFHRSVAWTGKTAMCAKARANAEAVA